MSGIGLFGPPVDVAAMPAESASPLVPSTEGLHAGVVYMVTFCTNVGILLQAVGAELAINAVSAIVDLAYKLEADEDAVPDDFEPVEQLLPHMGIADEDTAFALADTMFRAALGVAALDFPKEQMVASVAEQIQVAAGQAAPR